MTILQVSLAGLVAYLIGAFPTGVLATKLAGGPDVRYSGSGHTGGTNAMRLTNVWVGVAVVIVDGLKGLLAWGVTYIILLGSPWALPVAGAMAIIGHCWPIYTRFHGGLGLATGGGLLFITTPITLAFVIPVWAICFFGIFKKAYSPRCVAISLLIGIPLNLLLLPPEESIRWLLVFITPVLFIRHLPEWNRRE